MRDVSLAFTGNAPTWAALVGFGVAAALILWAYRRNRDRLSRAQLVFLPLLRGVLLLLLLGCLVEPVLSYRATPESDAPVVFLLDVSKSMSMPDTPGRQPRIQAALEPWVGPQGLAKQLERRFAAHYFVFDARTRPVDGSDDLARQKPSGEMTLIGEALASAAAQTGNEELAGIILLTDGANQSTVDAVAEARNIGAPIHVVAVGSVSASHKGKPDLAVTDVNAERFMSLDADNELTVDLEQRGYAGQTATVEVRDGDQVMASETVELAEASADISLRIRPTELGKHTFEVVARPFDTEEIVENNRRSFSAIVEKKHLAVLYIEGTPRWEYKFLKRALERDPIVRFTGFVRGRSDLFVRQGERTRKGVLPVTAEEFAAFDIIVLGDVSPRLFSNQQLEAMREVVADEGKGLVMIPGPRSRENGGFLQTPLAEILPATLSDSEDYAVTGEFVPRLASAGRDHPILAGLASQLAGAGAPALPGCLVLTKPSPGASVLMIHPGPQRGGQSLPLCLAQLCGKGRSMVMGIDTTWRWRMNPRGGSRTLHARFWGQTIRWLAGRKEDVGEDMPFIAYAGRDYYEPGEPCVLYARLHREEDEDAAPEPVPIEVSAEIRGPSGSVLTTPLEYVAGSAGLYKAKLSYEEPGGYAANVSAVKKGQALGEDTATFFIGHPYGEFDRVEMNERLLRTLAFETGGAFYTPETASSIPEDLVEAASRRGVFIEREFARMPAVYFAMVVCASVEWFLRKRRGLM